jgi:hypothetical protein
MRSRSCFGHAAKPDHLERLAQRPAFLGASTMVGYFAFTGFAKREVVVVQSSRKSFSAFNTSGVHEPVDNGVASLVPALEKEVFQDGTECEAVAADVLENLFITVCGHHHTS